MRSGRICPCIMTVERRALLALKGAPRLHHFLGVGRAGGRPKSGVALHWLTKSCINPITPSGRWECRVAVELTKIHARVCATASIRSTHVSIGPLPSCSTNLITSFFCHNFYTLVAGPKSVEPTTFLHVCSPCPHPAPTNLQNLSRIGPEAFKQ